MQIRIYIANT